MVQDSFNEAADEFDRAAEQLEAGARHLRVAAKHFRDKNVPRGCAHAFAAHGHMKRAQDHVDHRAVIHADHAVAE